MSDVSDALQWLAEAGVTPLADGRWLDSDDDGTVEMSGWDVAFDCSYAITQDEELAPADRIRVILGLYDLTGEYMIVAHLFAYLLAEPDPAAARTLWAGFRARLGAPGTPEWLRLSLVVDWFEDVRTSGTVFRALLGDDVRRLRDENRLGELSAGEMHHRAVNVLATCEAVAWEHKHDVFAALATVPELAPALLDALLRAYHGVYGNLEPAAALALLDRLDLPGDTEHLTTLRRVLAAGVAGHRARPELWAQMSGGGAQP